MNYLSGMEREIDFKRIPEEVNSVPVGVRNLSALASSSEFPIGYPDAVLDLKNVGEMWREQDELKLTAEGVVLHRPMQSSEFIRARINGCGYVREFQSESNLDARLRLMGNRVLIDDNNEIGGNNGWVEHVSGGGAKKSKSEGVHERIVSNYGYNTVGNDSLSNMPNGFQEMSYATETVGSAELPVEKKPESSGTETGNANPFKRLIDTGLGLISLGRNKDAALLRAVKSGTIQMVDKLICEGANVDATNELVGTTGLHSAAHYGYAEIIDLLIKKGANVNATDMKYQITPLHVAVQKCHTEIAKKLIVAKSNIDATTIEGISPLFMAAQNGDTEIVSLLISKKVNINITESKYGETPLHTASHKGHLEVVKKLISAGADINAKDKEGVTPLHFASQGGYHAVVKLLIDSGANVNVQEKIHGFAPLHFASQLGYLEIVNNLISKGANVNVEEYCQCYTPLHFAAQGGHEPVVRVLILANANIDAVGNTLQDTPAALAKEEGHESVFWLLAVEGRKQKLNRKQFVVD